MSLSSERDKYFFFKAVSLERSPVGGRELVSVPPVAWRQEGAQIASFSAFF